MVFWAASEITAVLSGNQWSIDTANELIIAYGSKPVARAAWQETIGCIIHTVHSGYMHGLGTDASSCLYPEHAYKRS